MKKLIILVLVMTILSAVLITGCSNKGVSDEQSVSVGNANSPASVERTSGRISVSPDKAIDIALADAGIKREDASFLGTPSVDEDNGEAHYDVEFKYNGYEYEYEISVYDGKVLKRETDNFNEISSLEATEITKQNNGYISIDEAKMRAVDDAGVVLGEVVLKKAHYDSDDTIPNFDIEFIADGNKYEYEINASDGSIIDKEIEKIQIADFSAKNESRYITSDKAKMLAYAHAGVDSADVKNSKAELENDDRIPYYEIEFVAGEYEYDYEINAETGKVIASDKELHN